MKYLIIIKNKKYKKYKNNNNNNNIKKINAEYKNIYQQM